MDEAGAKRRLYDQMMEYARAQAAKEMEGKFGKEKVSAMVPGVKEEADLDAVLQSEDLKEVGGPAAKATTPEMVEDRLKPTEGIAEDTLGNNPSAVKDMDHELLIALLNEKKR